MVAMDTSTYVEVLDYNEEKVASSSIDLLNSDGTAQTFFNPV